MTNAMIEDAVNETIELVAEKPAPKKGKKPAPKKPAKAKAKAEPKPEPEAKPEPITYHGYELADGVDVKDIEVAVHNVAEALDKITGTEAQLVGSFLTLGEFQSEASKMFKSTKLYGEFLKAELPASQSLDPALRSNCKWLYEALNVADHESSDILSVLSVNRIEDFKSGNPTVIRRSYKAAKKDAEKAEVLKAKAEEAGVDVSEAEKLIEEEAVAQAKKDQAANKRRLTNMEKKVKAFLSQHKSVEDCAEEAALLIREILETPQKDQMSFVERTV